MIGIIKRINHKFLKGSRKNQEQWRLNQLDLKSEIDPAQKKAMKTINQIPSVCRYCRHYTPQGHRGGICQKLSAPVKGYWEACSLGDLPFLPNLESLDTITLLESSDFQKVRAIPATSSDSPVEVEITLEEPQRSQTLINN